MAQSNEYPADDEMLAVFPEIGKEGVAVSRKAIAWSDVPQFVWYKVLSDRRVTRQNGGGLAMILTLRRRSDTTFDAWATSLMEKEIEACLEEADRLGNFFIFKEP